MTMPKPDWQSHDGSVVLYCADCRAILPLLEPGSVDAVVTDPPYGIDFKGCPASTLIWERITNDGEMMDLRFLLSMACTVVSFGANNYPNQLPHRGRWICWDKRTRDGACDTMIGSAFELAWTNLTHGFGRIYRVLHGGALLDGRPGRRVHPTQKPLQLMSSIIVDYTAPADSVFDPFMGSGTTGVACIKTGRRFIGIEIERKYFDIAVRRCQDALLVGADMLPGIAEPGLFADEGEDK